MVGEPWSERRVPCPRRRVRGRWLCRPLQRRDNPGVQRGWPRIEEIGLFKPNYVEKGDNNWYTWSLLD